MEYRFYVVEGGLAAKILNEHEEKYNDFKERAAEWEAAYAPLKLTTRPGFVATEPPLPDPKAYGLKKGPKGDGKGQYYRWRKDAEKTEPALKAAKITALKPDFKAMVETAADLPISRFTFEGMRAYWGTAGVVDGIKDIIFCKLPKSKHLDRTYPDGVREVKESEWLALMGR